MGASGRLLHGLAIASAMLISLPAFTSPAEAGDRHHHRHGHGHKHGYHGGKHHGGPYYRVERRYYGPPAYYAYPPGYYVAPAPVYYYPPPPRYVPHGPSISVTIPLD
ncbi:MAG: hypothetical protein KG075_15740 [Alphaproteobacteria bacterium]|nr:hypothetical protein [Alphaproteobacteria bacterium]